MGKKLPDTSPSVVPQDISLKSDCLSIVWSDARCTEFKYWPLRLQCPCASCVEEMTGRKLLVPTSVPADVIVVDYFLVGKYAIQFLWSDGHSSGIYTYKMLLTKVAK